MQPSEVSPPLSSPQRIAARLTTRLSARRVHGFAARGLAAFAAVHLLNHLLIPFGPEVYSEGQRYVRWLYRTPVIEPLLLLVVLTQATSGVRLLWLTRRNPHANRWQRWSGAYLSAFLFLHTSAALVQRGIVGRDTHFYWAAAVVTYPAALFFIPYYTLGITSLFVHVAIAARSRRVPYWGLGGLLFSALVIAGLLGAFTPFEIPVEYRLP